MITITSPVFSPAVITIQNVCVSKRVVVEYACSEESVLSSVALERGVYASLRLIRKSADLSTAKGHHIAVDKVLRFEKGLHCDVHVALPCTPWCSWHYVNIKKYGKDYERKLDKDRKKSLIMVKWLVRFMKVVRLRFL